MKEDNEEAIMLAAPFGEQRIVGTVAIEITSDRSSCGISIPTTRSIWIETETRDLLGRDRNADC